MGLRAYIIRRLLLLVPTLIGVSLLIFGVTQLLSPRQRAALFIQSEQERRYIDEIIKMHGLDQPFYIQYFNWLSQVIQGNLGWSYQWNEPVLQGIISRIPATLEIVIFSAPLTILLGTYLGTISAAYKDKPIDHLTRALSIAGSSLPSFWWAIILLATFYAGFGLFPPGRLGTYASLAVRSRSFIKYTGLNTIDGLLNVQTWGARNTDNYFLNLFGIPGPWITLDALRHLVLPCVVLSTIQTATLVRVMRSSMLESLSKGYITMARAKGLTEKEVLNKHARRNALIPVVTLSGLLVAGMLTGVVITETVFNINGIGRYAAQAAYALDIAAVLGFSLFASVVYVISNLVVDVIYAYIDPRIRLD